MANIARPFWQLAALIDVYFRAVRSILQPTTNRFFVVFTMPYHSFDTETNNTTIFKTTLEHLHIDHLHWKCAVKTCACTKHLTDSLPKIIEFSKCGFFLIVLLSIFFYFYGAVVKNPNICYKKNTWRISRSLFSYKWMNFISSIERMPGHTYKSYHIVINLWSVLVFNLIVTSKCVVKFIEIVLKFVMRVNMSLKVFINR